jgi:hypothetical protein
MIMKAGVAGFKGVYNCANRSVIAFRDPPAGGS